MADENKKRTSQTKINSQADLLFLFLFNEKNLKFSTTSFERNSCEILAEKD